MQRDPISEVVLPTERAATHSRTPGCAIGYVSFEHPDHRYDKRSAWTGVPIAYPRMVFLESALDSKFNPLVHLGRKGAFGLSGFVNKFNAEAELLDDLVSPVYRPLAS